MVTGLQAFKWKLLLLLLLLIHTIFLFILDSFWPPYDKRLNSTLALSSAQLNSTPLYVMPPETELPQMHFSSSLSYTHSITESLLLLCFYFTPIKSLEFCVSQFYIPIPRLISYILCNFFYSVTIFTSTSITQLS